MVYFSCLFFFYFLRATNRNKYKSQNGLPPKKPNKFWAFIKKLLNVIFNKKFLYSCFIIFCTGFFSRYLILIYFDVNVFTDIFNEISILYYTIMSVHIRLVREIIFELCNQPVLMMNANPPAGGGVNANPPAGGGVNTTGMGGNLRAGKANGPIQVNDPNNQNYQYVVGGVNQPLLSNIARTLDHQRTLGLSSLSRYTFTPQQEQYILTFLLHNHQNVYDNIMQGQNGNPNQPI